MAKTVKSFSLEGDIIDIIVKYKETNNLSSDSAALERILLKFDSTNINNEKLDNIEFILLDIFSKTQNIKNEIVYDKIEEANEVDVALDNIYSNMN